MASKRIRSDVEGDLFALEGGPAPHCAKRLTIDVVWYMDEWTDLQDAAENVVTGVELDTDGRDYVIHYHPSLKPLDLPSLRQLLSVDDPLGPWRVAVLADHLCRQLQSLHEYDMPEFVVHAERLAVRNGDVVLLPTFGGILPPFSDVPAIGGSGWPAYAAPETLRTRALEAASLKPGDVYSLGCLLAAVCCPAWEPPADVDVLDYVESRVEGLAPGPPAALPEKMRSLAGVMERMRRFVPEERPGLEETRQDFERLAYENSPSRLCAELRDGGRTEEAARLLETVVKLPTKGMFGIPERDRLIMEADLAMAKTSPEFMDALDLLDRAESPTEWEWDTQFRVGEVYRKFTTHPQYIERSLEAFRLAVVTSDYRAEVVASWRSALEACTDANLVLKYSQKAFDVDDRPLWLVKLRAKFNLQEGFPQEAWFETAHSFKRFRFDQELYKLGLSAAELFRDKVDLIEWIARYKDEPGYAAARAIVQQVLGGNPEPFLAQARAYAPPEES